MPTYTNTWDETKPAGSRDRSLGDDDIREFKAAIRERLATDHEFAADETGSSVIGYHKKVTLTKRGSNEAAVNDAYILFSKDAGSDAIELYGVDDDGNIIQFTVAGKLAVLGSQAWRSGDKLLSSNTTVPTGWTDQSSTYDNNFIRISSGTPLTSGGADTHTHAAGSYAGPSHTHTTSIVSGGTEEAAAGSGLLGNLGEHEHTISASGTGAVTGTSASANNIPVYIQLKMYSKV